MLELRRIEFNAALGALTTHIDFDQHRQFLAELLSCSMEFFSQPHRIDRINSREKLSRF